jgi:AraC-like DNA-binding protein
MLSYHLLTRALIQRDNSPFHMLRHAVSSTIHGFVPHATYVDVARHVEEQPPADTVLSLRMNQLIQSDFNPLIDLVKGCNEEQFAQRWNLVNTKLQLGVTTLVRGMRYEARHTQQEDSDTDLRRRVMTAFIDQLCPDGSGCSTSTVAPRRSLCDIASAGELDGSVYADLIGFLYESPGADLGECVAALGCSKRTLQRLINVGGMTFLDIRQAVRICAAKELVRGTLQSFTDVALGTGFYDAAHFCHAFHKSCGLSPSEYRTLSRSGLMTEAGNSELAAVA